jgi:hypothetical protein
VTSIRVGGNCRLCGNYTQSSTYEEKGLCMPCYDKLYNWTKEELVNELNKCKKELWNAKYQIKETSQKSFREKHWRNIFICDNKECEWTGMGKFALIDEDFNVESDEENNLICPICGDLLSLI